MSFKILTLRRPRSRSEVLSVKLALGHAIPRTRAKTPEESQNEHFINSLYASIALEDINTILAKLTPEIEWWFHGPPLHQHMKALLTGETSCHDFHFMPTKVGLLANKVFVEGHGRDSMSGWVHVWTVSDGKITQLREYYNTAIMVTTCTVNSPCHSADSTTSESASGGDSGTWSASADSFAVLHVSVCFFTPMQSAMLNFYTASTASQPIFAQFCDIESS